MRAKTYYEILGVDSRASKSVIEAAYLRRRRLHGQDRLPGADKLDEVDQAEQRIERAYWTLIDAGRRADYDMMLHQQTVEVKQMPTDLHKARKILEPTGAWLAHQRRHGGYIYLRIGWAADYSELRREIERRIPHSGRSFDEKTGLWRILTQYRTALVDLFDNFEDEAAERVAPPSVPVYQPLGLDRRRKPLYQGWQGWPLLIAGVLCVLIVAALLFPADESRDELGDSRSLANPFNLAATETPTATPVATPMLLLPVRPIYASVHLREGPGTDYPSLDLLRGDEIYRAIGRSADSSWIVVSAAQPGWSAAFTLEIEGDVDALPVYRASTRLPSPIPTPTPP